MVCEHDFDEGMLHMLDALWERGMLEEAVSCLDGFARQFTRKAFRYVKEVVEFHPRDKVSNWRGIHFG